MYRDAHATLDERDGAVGAILIGEALIASCERARRLGESHGLEAWRAIRDAHDEFPEIWRSLDLARTVLARRGVNVVAYDELRPHVCTRLATSDDADGVRVDPVALDDARRAAGELRLAVAGADWAAIERRTSGLVKAPQLRSRNRAIAGGFIALFVVAAVMWVSSLEPRPRLDRDAAMRREIAGIAQQRRVKIVELQHALGETCTPAIAHELAKQLVMDGRNDDARSFAEVYTERCGGDPVILRWANAPRPHK